MCPRQHQGQLLISPSRQGPSGLTLAQLHLHLVYLSLSRPRLCNMLYQNWVSSLLKFIDMVLKSLPNINPLSLHNNSVVGTIIIPLYRRAAVAEVK